MNGSFKRDKNYTLKFWTRGDQSTAVGVALGSTAMTSHFLLIKKNRPMARKGRKKIKVKRPPNWGPCLPGTPLFSLWTLWSLNFAAAGHGCDPGLAVKNGMDSTVNATSRGPPQTESWGNFALGGHLILDQTGYEKNLVLTWAKESRSTQRITFHTSKSHRHAAHICKK